MRLVKPMPEEVEALARSGAPAAKPTSRRRKATPAAANPAAEGEKPPRQRGAAQPKPAPGAVFDQRGQEVGTQINVAGDYHGAPAPAPVSAPAGSMVDIAPLRTRLQRLDAVEIESLCLDHFPTVYDKFDRGLRRDEKMNLLLDYVRYRRDEAARLTQLLK